MTAAGELGPGSPLPRDSREMDLLLRRVPEVALQPEFRNLRFLVGEPAPESARAHASRVARLADAAYLARLRDAVAELEQRALRDDDGGLRFIASTLHYFVTSLPAERHPLVVALYFLSLACEGGTAERPEILASQMDEYESGL